MGTDSKQRMLVANDCQEQQIFPGMELFSKCGVIESALHVHYCFHVMCLRKHIKCGQTLEIVAAG